MNMFNRRAIEEIKAWYNRRKRKPLVIRGARQVGKTTAVRLAASQLLVDIIEINLERHQELEPLFKSYKLDDLLFNVSLISGKTLTRQSKGILFLDEAQATPAAYSCLRYFWEEMPELAVVLTGSLLDQVLHNDKLSTPVGRIEHLFMAPLTFDEFLAATGASKALNTIEMLTLDNIHLLPDSVHNELLAQVRRYTLTGGMPSCVQTAIDTNFNHAEIVKYQTELLQAYKDDFSKYAGSQTALKLNAFFNGIISQIGLQFSHKQANEIALNSSGNNRQLYYWQPPKSEGQAEIDFLYESGNMVYPVELKSSAGGTIKSLHSYMVKKQADQAIRISSAKPSLQELVAKVNNTAKPFRLINLPFYLVNQIDRMVGDG